MRKLFVLFLLIVSVFMVGTAQAGWHEWSQGTRNVAILEEAYRDINKPVGLNCKEWARKVVKNASGGLVEIPSTVDPPGYYWYPHSYVYSRFGRIENTNIGEIVQMYTIYGYPHTAIVWARSPSGITFIESNWGKPPLTVKIRYVSYSTFYTEVYGYKFTIHTIL